MCACRRACMHVKPELRCSSSRYEQRAIPHCRDRGLRPHPFTSDQVRTEHNKQKHRAQTATQSAQKHQLRSSRDKPTQSSRAGEQGQAGGVSPAESGDCNCDLKVALDHCLIFHPVIMHAGQMYTHEAVQLVNC